MSCTRNHMRIACLAGSLTTTAPSTIRATRISPRSSMPITDPTTSRASASGMTSRHSSPASNNWVTCFAKSTSLLGRGSGSRLDETTEGELEPFARLDEREAHVVGAERAVEIAGRHEQAGLAREPVRDLPSVVGTVGGAQPQIERGVAAVVHQTVRCERVAHEVAAFGIAA